MTISIEKDGWKITAGSLKDLQLVIQAIEGTAKPDTAERPRGPGRPRKIDKAQVEREKLTERKRLAMTVLKALQAAGANGVSAENLNKTLGLKHPKSLGSKMGIVNKMISEAGLHPDEVYLSYRTDETRIWEADQSAVQRALIAISNIDSD